MMRALFLDNQSRVSINKRTDCPPRLAGLVRSFVRTAVDVRRRCAYYEEETPKLMGFRSALQGSLALAFEAARGQASFR